MSSCLQSIDDLPDLVIPVPLHPARLRERGFNQSLEIARLVTKRLQLELDGRSVKRIRPTPPQTGLSEKERRRNLRAAFTISRDLRGRHVALLDDVITTGATLSELSYMLTRHGVERVDLWALARTPMHSG
jgi:ComF family protein